MDSELLVEYMRTGTMPPLAKGDAKPQVEAKLGPPDKWKGQLPDIAWSGAPLTDFHDSWAWHYGSLCVSFPDPPVEGLRGISLDLGFGNFSAPFRFPAPFAGLPQTPFTLRELVELMDRGGVQHKRQRTGLWVSEGNIGIGTLHGDYSPSGRVTYLFPHPYDEVEDTSRDSLRQKLIDSYSEWLRQSDLSAADRSVGEEFLRELKARKEAK